MYITCFSLACGSLSSSGCSLPSNVDCAKRNSAMTKLSPTLWAEMDWTLPEILSFF